MAIILLFVQMSLSILIAVLLFYQFVYKFYSTVKLYPRGPMPAPIIGNCLMLISQLSRHQCYFFESLAQKYGDVYTFWLASKPIVIISGARLAKEAFNKYEFCDRSEPSLESRINEFFYGGNKSWSAMNISDTFKSLRTVSVQAIRKFLSIDKMSQMTHNIVGETVVLMKQNENGNSFVPFKYINSIFIRLLTESTFGKKVTIDDRLIEQIFAYFESFQHNVIHLVASNSSPLYKYLFNATKAKTSNDNMIKAFTLWYRDIMVKQSQNCGNNADNIAESIISIANTIRLKNISETNAHLSESNLIGSLITLFFAASDTSLNTFKWMLLLMAYYPEMQRKMRNEININIGNNKIADLSDKEKCVYVNAFIRETLRYRTALPLAIPHKISSDTVLGENIFIPKGTMIILNQLSILNDSRYWKNPDNFNPERFLDCEQKLVATDLSSFIPFGTGKRMCVGDRFAMNMLFLVLSSLLQATTGMKFVLSDKQRTDLEPKKLTFILEPKTFEIFLANDE